MTIEERELPAQNHELEKERRNTFGLGLLKGMGVTFKHLFKRNTVIQYPDEKQDLPPRTRGVIALKEENCTVCMLCARECPDWCIYIDSHKETLPPKREGGRQRKRNVLDRFAIDYGLCMYCGICVEVCPYDALFWSREFEYAEYDIRELTHEKERLSDWMATVLPPPELEDGAEIPGQPAAPPDTTTAAATGARPATATSSAVEARPEQAAAAPTAGTFATEPARTVESLPAEERAPETTSVAEPAPAAMAPETVERGEPGVPDRAATDERPEGRAVEQTSPGEATERREAALTQTGSAPDQVTEESPGPAATEVSGPPEGSKEIPRGAPPEGAETVPAGGSAAGAAAAPVAPAPAQAEPAEDPNEVYEHTLREQLDKGSSPQVAEARAKVARVKAERGLRKAGETPAPAVEPSAPEAGVPQEPTPPGAPSAEPPTPEPGPVAPEAEEQKQAPPQAAETQPAAEAPAPPAPPKVEEAAPPAPAPVAETPAPAPTSEDPDAVYERVLAEQQAQGVSNAVAVARAKAARIRAQKGTKGPGA
jgi:NADH-quinone oxidoreductase chain I